MSREFDYFNRVFMVQEPGLGVVTARRHAVQGNDRQGLAGRAVEEVLAFFPGEGGSRGCALVDLAHTR
ncbi:MAG: hypothetical protein Q8N23_12730 [Archangium sp.]|nr:hypothetical protein [Archangium sp.]MDP3574540.1 hypothetical protein [Archangium sp.]